MKKTILDVIKKTIKLLLINAGVLIGSMMVLYLLSIAIFASIFNVIFGDGAASTYAVNLVIRICLPLATTLAICIPKRKNAEARREFLKNLNAEPYNRKEDYKSIIKTKNFYIECGVFAILYIVMFFVKNPPQWIFMIATIIFPFGPLWNDAGILFMANPPQWIFLLSVIIFPLVNLWNHTTLHKRWASERIRLSSESTSTNG